MASRDTERESVRGGEWHRELMDKKPGKEITFEI